MPLDMPSKEKKQARRKKFLEKSRKRSEAFLKKSREKGYLPKDFMTPAEKDKFNKEARKADAQTADEVGAKKNKLQQKPKKATSPSIDETFKSLERLKELQEGKKPKNKKPKQRKRKPFDPFVTIEAKGGGKVKGYKKGGPITYRMSGGQVVDNSYD
jgi:hypothetical protein